MATGSCHVKHFGVNLLALFESFASFSVVNIAPEA
jgi:hypothetical protein